MERVIHLKLTNSGRLDAVLATELSLSRSLIVENISRGNLLVNGVVCTKPSKSSKEGDVITGVITDPRESELIPTPGSLDIIFEDESLIALNKQQGIVVHPAPSHRGATLVHHLLHYLKSDSAFKELSPERPGIVHRLDRGTTGVIVIAKNRIVLDAMSRQFKERAVEKTYECIVWGKADAEGSYNTPIGRDPVDPKRMSLKARKARLSETHWKRLNRFNHFSHLEVYPRTGRTHQIRVHLSEGGFPIVGDKLYQRRLIQKRLALAPKMMELISQVDGTCLHAKKLIFTHPLTHKLLTITAPRPKSFDSVLSLITTYDT